MNINISHLRQNLHEYLARAQRGERVRVTSRGKVVAEIVPSTATGSIAKAARARLSVAPPQAVDIWTKRLNGAGLGGGQREYALPTAQTFEHMPTASHRN